MHWHRARHQTLILLKVCRNFKKVSILIYLYGWAANQIVFKTLFSTNTHICRFLRLHLLIECLQVNRIYVTSFWFHCKLVLEKARKPACYAYCFLLIFYINFLKREFWIFSNEHFDRLHYTNDQVLYGNKGDYIWEALYQVKDPC